MWFEFLSAKERNMKKSTLTLIAASALAIAAVALSSCAANGEKKDIDPGFSGGSGIHEIIGENEKTSGLTYADGALSAAGNKNITSAEIKPGTYRIASGAFKGCKKLTTVTVPDSVKIIDDNAFEDCVNLKSITLPDDLAYIGSNAFLNCDPDLFRTSGGLKYVGKWLIGAENELVSSANIESGTKGIASGAFRSCTELSSVSIPDSVENIGKYAFYNCKNDLYEIYGGLRYVDGWLTDVDNLNMSTANVKLDARGIAAEAFAFSDKISYVSVSPSVKVVGARALANASGVKDVFISHGITEIDAFAFENCKSLENIDIADSVTEIGYGAFANCEKLSAIDIPASVSKIAASAFKGCNDSLFVKENDLVYVDEWLIGNENMLMRTADIYDETRGIADGVFAGCKDLESVNVPYRVKSIGDGAFENCEKLASIYLRDNVAYLGERAFAGCVNLRTARLSSAIAEIMPYTFADCKAMYSVIFRSGLKKIDENAFENCFALISFSLPKIESVGENAFKNCKNLKDIKFNGTTDDYLAVSVARNAFSSTKLESISCTDGKVAV